MADPYGAVPSASPYANWGQRVGAYLADVASAGLVL
jgi:hypothetical protein